MKTSYYAPRRIIKANHSEVIIRLSEVYSILISRKYEMHVIFIDKEYVTSVIYKSSLI